MSKPPIDIHTHLLNYQITPEKVYFGGREWDLKKLSPLIHEYCDSGIDDVAEWIANLFLDKKIDSDPLAKVFFTPLSEQWKLFEEMPCTPNVMTIDFGESLGKQETAGKYAIICSGDADIYSHGINPDNYMALPAEAYKRTGTSAIKAYPAMWEDTKRGYIALCRLSHKSHIPIIAHASKGGIGRNKANNNPLKWWDALMEYQDSVICFAHAGGGHDSDWWKSIEKMALEFRFPDGRPRIYWDTAFHDGAILDSQDYFPWLRRALGGDACDGGLFGSDWPLFLVYGYTHKELIDAYSYALGEEYWDMISNINPRRFLGIGE